MWNYDDEEKPAPVEVSRDRVVIGTVYLVLIGSLLGAFVSPYWIGLAAFVGAGLVFAGITDTCGMGMLLARMPWNQVSETSPTEPTSCESTDLPKSTHTCCR